MSFGGATFDKPGGYFWRIYINAPQEKKLTEGLYLNAEGFISSGRDYDKAGFELTEGSTHWSGDTICNFHVIEIEYDDRGAITRLAIDFKLKNNYRAAPFGSIRYNSEIPISSEQDIIEGLY